MNFTMPLFFRTIKKEGSENMGLDYDYPTDGSKACANKPMKVAYSGKKYGEIKKVKDLAKIGSSQKEQMSIRSTSQEIIQSNYSLTEFISTFWLLAIFHNI